MSAFEATYRSDPDPWDYETSAYEQEKYARTLAACGPGPFTRALELGGSIGVFSELLAPRCAAVVTLDDAPTAVRAARERLADLAHVEPRLGGIPADVPDGPFDLVVASEVLYYLDRRDLDRTLDRLRDVMSVGARLVAVHYRPVGPERPLSAGRVHQALRDRVWLHPVAAARRERYLLDVLVRS